MPGLGATTANNMLDHVLGTTTWTKPTAVFLSLHTADPGTTGANEVGAGWYTAGGRKQPATGWNASTIAGSTNNGAVTYPTVSGADVTVTHIGVWDNATVGAGTFLTSVTLSSSKTFGDGSVPIIPDAGMTVSALDNFSDYLKPLIVDHLLGLTTYTKPASTYLAMYITDIDATDVATEASTGGYARQLVGWDASASGATDNTAEEDFGTASANVGNVKDFGIRDAITTGNLLIFGDWNTANDVNNGDTYKVIAGALDLSGV